MDRVEMVFRVKLRYDWSGLAKTTFTGHFRVKLKSSKELVSSNK